MVWSWPFSYIVSYLVISLVLYIARKIDIRFRPFSGFQRSLGRFCWKQSLELRVRCSYMRCPIAIRTYECRVIRVWNSAIFKCVYVCWFLNRIGCSYPGNILSLFFEWLYVWVLSWNKIYVLWVQLQFLCKFCTCRLSPVFSPIYKLTNKLGSIMYLEPHWVKVQQLLSFL